jgi:hypothetical protein
VRSTVGSYSYRNLPVRIVALRGGTEQLAAALAKAGTLPAHTQADVLPGASR